MKIAIIEGKMYLNPVTRVTKNGKPFLSFSVGVNSSYKKDGKQVDIPPTYFSFYCFNERLMEQIREYGLKKRICLIANIEKIESIVDGKRNVQEVYIAVAINPPFEAVKSVMDAIKAQGSSVSTSSDFFKEEEKKAEDDDFLF